MSETNGSSPCCGSRDLVLAGFASRPCRSGAAQGKLQASQGKPIVSLGVFLSLSCSPSQSPSLSPPLSPPLSFEPGPSHPLIAPFGPVSLSTLFSHGTTGLVEISGRAMCGVNVVGPGFMMLFTCVLALSFFRSPLLC